MSKTNKTTKMKVLELVVDWALWPGYEANDLDSTNVSRMKEALKAGMELPPIIADKKSFRIIDGFHRQKAYLSVFGEDVTVSVDLREYRNDAEMFLEAARLISIQGLPLSPKDKVHVFIVGRRMKLPLAKLAVALGMSKETADDLIKKRTARTSKGEVIPLAAGASKLAGKSLNKSQEKFARTSNGMQPIVNARLLLNALRANSTSLTQKELDIYVELRDELTVRINSTIKKGVAV